MSTLPGINTSKLTILLAALLILTSFSTLSAQVSLNASNLSSFRTADLSDEQLRQYMRQAEAQGVTMEQALLMATARGLPPNEAQELRMRLSALGEQSVGSQVSPSGRIGQPFVADTQRSQVPSSSSEESEYVFGSELFSFAGFNFAPSMNIPTPSNYQLGTGDELIISIWGDRTDQLYLTVSTEGTVNLQNRGPVFVSGLTIEEAKTRLMRQLSQLYGGLNPDQGDATTFADISLGKVRTINVTVTGEVIAPGTYSMSSLATVFNALYSSGGPGNVGSFRRIRVIRENRTVVEFDLYDFLISGNQSRNIRLHDQDVVQVLPYQSRVKVEGQILRPATYELLGTETYQDLVTMAGGYTSRAYTKHAQIRRYTDTQRRIVTLPETLYSDFILQNGDEVVIAEVLDRFENRVMISGGVWRSGEFELKPDLTLSQLIDQAGGIRPDAFRSRGLINRMRDDLSLEQISFNVENVLSDPSRFDILLQREDDVTIWELNSLRDTMVVEIHGAVRNAGIYRWRENMSLEDLILTANGFLESAALSRIEISRRIMNSTDPNRLVETINFELDGSLTLNGDSKSFEIMPFDIVYVYRRPDFNIQRFVNIEGEVMYPGQYAITSRNERISDIIARAGGLTNEAYIPGARVHRQQRVIDRAQVEYNFLASTEQVNDNDNDTAIRIGIDLQTALRDPASRENLYIREGDVIRIPKMAQTVRVMGAVMQEVEVRYVPGANYSYYIDRAGGYTERALKKRSYVIYANGDVDRNKRFIGLTVSTPPIQPGAQIVIPAKPETQRMTTQEIVSISSMVVSMTTTLLLAIDRLSR